MKARLLKLGGYFSFPTKMPQAKSGTYAAKYLNLFSLQIGRST